MNTVGNEQPAQEAEEVDSGVGGHGLAGDSRPLRDFIPSVLQDYFFFERARMLYTLEQTQKTYADQMELLREEFARQFKAVETLFADLSHQLSLRKKQADAEIEYAVNEAKKRLSSYLEEVNVQYSQGTKAAERALRSATLIKQLTELGKAHAKESEATRRLQAAAAEEWKSAHQRRVAARQEVHAVWEDYQEAKRTQEKSIAPPEKGVRPTTPPAKSSSRQVASDTPQDSTALRPPLLGEDAADPPPGREPVSCKTYSVPTTISPQREPGGDRVGMAQPKSPKNDDKGMRSQSPPDPILDHFSSHQAVQPMIQMLTCTRVLLDRTRQSWESAHWRLEKLQSTLSKVRVRLKKAAESDDPKQKEDFVREAAREQADDLINNLRYLDELISGKEPVAEKELIVGKDEKVKDIPPGPKDLLHEIQKLRNEVFDYVHNFGEYEEYEIQPGKSVTEYSGSLDMCRWTGQGIPHEDNHVVEVIHKGYVCKRDVTPRVYPKPRVFVYRRGGR